jgi:hypothetical protein
MQDALQSGAGSQIQKRLALGAEFDPFPEYTPRTIHFLPSNIHHHFARAPLTQPAREVWITFVEAGIIFQNAIEGA